LAGQIAADLAATERGCVGRYLAERGEIEALQGELGCADAVLGELQELLGGFRADLSGISADIRQLQTSSLSMSRKLGNRAALDRLLTGYLDEAVVSPAVAEAVLRGGVDERFRACVRELSRAHRYLSGRGPEGSALGLVPCDLPSGREVLAHADKLRLTAVAKTRE
ncbi:hypothetical protein TeGR_g2604, partial [Tetraparma gracilis]